MVVPNYTLLSSLGMTNQWYTLPLIYMAYHLPITIWILMGGLEAVPVEIDEAAKIDGAGRWYIIFRLVMPLSVPAMASAALFIFLGAWNEFVVSSVLVSSQSLYPLQVSMGLAFFGCEDYEVTHIDPEKPTTPYGYLCLCARNNEAYFNRYAEALLEDALEKGASEQSVHEWLKLCHSCMEFEPETTVTPTNKTTLACNGTKIPLALGDEYVIENGAIYYLKGNHKELLCRHLIFPAGVLKDRETGIELLVIAENHDKQWNFRTMPKSVVFRSNGLMKMVDYGVDVAQGTAKKLCAFLQTVEFYSRNNLPLTYISDHLGWNNDFSEFVPYDGRIKYSKESQYPDEFKCVNRCKGTLDEWRDLFKTIRDDAHVKERIGLATSFASVLIKPMSAYPFMLDIWGASAAGKSTLLVAAASIWAYPELDGNYVSRFDSTAASNEQKAMFCCDLPLMLDEMQTIQSKKNYEEYVYKLCEGKPRGRATSSGGLRSQGTWHNTILVTGENPIVNESSMGGAQRRVVTLECNEKLFDNNETCGNLRENLRNCYGTAGRAFIEQLLSEGNMQHARDLLEENKALIAQHANGFQNLPGALILTADALAEEWIFQDNVRLSVEDIAVYLKSDVVNDMYERTHTVVAQWIISNQKQLIPADKLSMSDGSKPIGRHMKHKEKEIYAILHTELKAMMQAKGLKMDSYLAWAARNGKIVTAKDGNSYMINVKFGAGSNAIQTSCYAFIIDKLSIADS